MKGKIVCGFAGIGKSYLAKKSKWIDLESTPFNKNWELYSNVAIHMSNNGYNVLLSCHKELRDILNQKKIKFNVVVPKPNLRQEYIERYKNRGNNEQFIKLFEDNFEKFISEIINTEDYIILLDKNMYLKDIVKKLR